MRSCVGTVALAVIAAAHNVADGTAQARRAEARGEGGAQPDARAASVMAEVRKALGGEQKIASLKGLSLRADYRREMSAGPAGGGGMVIMMTGPGGPGGNGAQATGKIEIDVELPDRYLRSDIGAGGFALTRTEGFEGARPFIELVPNTPGMRVQADSPAADPARAMSALKRSHTELARLFLALTGGTQPGVNASYAYGGVAESPDGKADIIDVAGPEDFKARLFVDTESHLPLMLTFVEPEPRLMMRRGGRSGQRGNAPATEAPGGAPAATPRGDVTASLTPEQQAEIEKQRKEAEAAPPKLIEYRLYFSDHRKVDGLALPHRIVRGTAEKTTEEWEVTSYKVNPVFKADRFKVGA
jgi:hypothetical protein